MKLSEEFFKGIWRENPVLVLILGMCPSLATSSNATNGMGMGLATTFVLLCSNVVISAVRNLVPTKIRIPCYIVVIATFVTVVDLLMQAYTQTLYNALGIFIPLIVVNCIVLGRVRLEELDALFRDGRSRHGNRLHACLDLHRSDPGVPRGGHAV